MGRQAAGEGPGTVCVRGTYGQHLLGCVLPRRHARLQHFDRQSPVDARQILDEDLERRDRRCGELIFFRNANYYKYAFILLVRTNCVAVFIDRK